jgi:hypothetical protein
MAAHVQTDTIVITVSKLVRVDEDSLITEEILKAIESVAQELLGDTVIVEAEQA